MQDATDAEEVLLNTDPLALRDQLVAEACRRFARSDVSGGTAALAKLKFATIDEETLEKTDPFLEQIARGRAIIATCDHRRRPTDREVIIIYGNYPHMFENVVVNNPMKRHVATFGEFDYDKVEYDNRWERIGQIYIINAENRPDRYDLILRELATAKAPLHRVCRIPAIMDQTTGVPEVDGQIGALRSHIDALRTAKVVGYEHVLIFEDDFCFTTDLEDHMHDLQRFLNGDYEYTVCLLATSKYGRIIPRDDLISISRQPCTNAAAYLVSGAHLDELLSVQQDALRLLIETRDTHKYSDDRYWAILQPSGRFLVFRRKFGFQCSSLSDIERQICRYLD